MGELGPPTRGGSEHSNALDSTGLGEPEPVLATGGHVDVLPSTHSEGGLRASGQDDAEDAFAVDCVNCRVTVPLP